jgi:hypothetical protein
MQPFEDPEMRARNETGIALITALLILVLLGVLLEGFIITINSDQRLIGIDRGKTQAFYGSMAGLENLTADLGTLFETNYSPSSAQLDALTATPPAFPNIQFIAPDGGSGYTIVKGTEEQRTVPTGPYAGLVALITPYTMTAIARAPGSAEVEMQRQLQTVAVPVFQFGIFSENDLSFHAGPDFNFGGRVHTNANLYLAQNTGNTLTMSDKVTALGEVVRTNLINTRSILLTSHNGTVRVASSPGTYRNLQLNEGSLVGTIGSEFNTSWPNISLTSYNGNILNGRTGAKRMSLPLVSMGAAPIDLIRRPAPNEDTTDPGVLDQRFFSMASLRILLSDRESDITSLPTVTGTAPVLLTGSTPNGVNAYAVQSALADYLDPGATLIGGYIKIEMQDQDRNWHDVTNEILNLGIAGRTLNTTGTVCSDQPNAVIRVQRFKENPPNCAAGTATNFWPNTLYDTREGNPRDQAPAWPNQNNVYIGGVMHYVELDVNNLSRWFRGEIGTSGTDAMKETGYVVYFSDRRTNRNSAGDETGEYGYEDFVNSTTTDGLPDGTLENAEDVNRNGVQDMYGTFPHEEYVYTSAPLNSSARPWSTITANVAKRNRPVFFRRALKLVNGARINLGTKDGGIPNGLAVVSENPLYIQGNYNANAASDGFNDSTNVACSVIADAVSFLSANWNDRNSFSYPHDSSSRVASTTYYRTAIISGNVIPFAWSSGNENDFGTDGGVHNFLRYLESWSGRTLYFRGSIISLYYSRQGVGIYKCGGDTVYSPPSRGYNFDVEFLNPALLPPRTPMFRDVNITGFTQVKNIH